jgi:hypothetical protein
VAKDDRYTFASEKDLLAFIEPIDDGCAGGAYCRKYLGTESREKGVP